MVILVEERFTSFKVADLYSSTLKSKSELSMQREK